MGFEHHSAQIQWDDDSKSTHAKSKMKREEVLREMCELHGIDVLLLGHHADDQIETMLQRVYKASGLSGLSSIPSSRRFGYHGTRIVRPLLDFRKHELVRTCEAYGFEDYVRDPSNNDIIYDRARIRDVLKSRDSTKIASLTSLTETCREAENRVREEILTLLKDQTIRTNDWFNFSMLDLKGFEKLSDTLQRRVLSYMFSFVSPFDSYKVKSETLERFLTLLHEGGGGGRGVEKRLRLKRNFTAALGLAGRWESDGSAVLFTRENQRFGTPTKFIKMSPASIEQTNSRGLNSLPVLRDDVDMTYARNVWDSRFVLHSRVPTSNQDFLENLSVGVLKPNQWTKILKTVPNLRYLGSLPSRARVVLPVIFGDESVMSEKEERKLIQRMRRKSRNETCWIQDREGKYFRIEWENEMKKKSYDQSRDLNDSVVAIPHLGWIRPDVSKAIHWYWISYSRNTCRNGYSGRSEVVVTKSSNGYLFIYMSLVKIRDKGGKFKHTRTVRVR